MSLSVSEILVVREIKNYCSEEKLYTNQLTGFVGTIKEAKLFAERHKFSGVEIMKQKNGKTEFIQVK